MYLRDADPDMCPHPTFSGCRCYDQPVDFDDLDERAPSTYRLDNDLTPGPDGYPSVTWREPRRCAVRFTKNPSKWTDASGVTRRIVDMTDEHIANSLRFVVAHEGLRSRRARAMLAELRSRAGG